ncbi:MAG: hypothetical protein WAL98_16905 [Desulfatiglandaceae bacterium]|jgi:hypothetical protein
MSTDLSIMIMKEIGKVRRFQISSRLLFWSSLFFASYIVVSIFAVNAYFEKRRENTSLEKKVTMAREAASDSKRELLRLQQHLAVLEDYIHLIENPGDKTGRAKDPEASGKPQPAEAPPPSGTSAAHESLQIKAALSSPELVRAEREPAGKAVAIQDFAVNLENTRMTVSFKLVNTSLNQGSLRGYIHMITLDRNADPPLIRTFPHETLEKGIPVSYKRGQLFQIKHFMTIRGKFFLSGTKQSPSSLRVFIYDHEGLMLLDKAFDLNNAI